MSDRFQLYHGDSLDVLRTLEADSIDSLVTDPPAGIAFMSKKWDDLKSFQARTRRSRLIRTLRTMRILPMGYIGFVMFTVDWAFEVIRVLKPGAHGLIWALPRTADLTQMGLRMAGFEIRDVVVHLNGQGMPKGGSVGKMIDKRLGREREILGYKDGTYPTMPGFGGETYRDTLDRTRVEVTKPASQEAQQWEGWSSNLKPAAEYWILVRKPIGESTLVDNVLKWGVGALNIDGCRLGDTGGGNKCDHRDENGNCLGHETTTYRKTYHGPKYDAGRWPPNAMFSHLPECERVGTKRVKSTKGEADYTPTGKQGSTTVTRNVKTGAHHGDEDGMETVEAWDCAPGCPVAELDEQSGHSKRRRGLIGPRKGEFCTGKGFDLKPSVRGHDDEGGASRFFPTFPSGEEPKGRWPANAVLSHLPECELVGTKIVGSGEAKFYEEDTVLGENVHEGYKRPNKSMYTHKEKGQLQSRGQETVEDWNCAPGCPVAELDKQSGDRPVSGRARSGDRHTGASAGYGGGWGEAGERALPNDSGGASRFFYTAKVSRGEKHFYCPECDLVGPLEKAQEHDDHSKQVARHPTQKSIALMRWMTRLITPQGGTVLDVFMGSGTTGVAAMREGANFIGIEREKSHYKVSEYRITREAGGHREREDE